MMKKDMLQDKKIVLILCIISTFLWGSAFPVLKRTYAELNIPADDVTSRMVLAGMRFMLAGVMLFGLSLLQKKKVKQTKKGFGSLVLLGLVNTFLQYFFFYNGLANTSGIKGAILASVGTFFVIIASHFVYKNDKMNMRKVLGLIFGLGGILAVNWQKTAGGFSLSFNPMGEGFLICSGLAATFATLYAKRLSRSFDAVVMNAWQFLFGSMGLLGVGIIVGGGYHLEFTPLAILLLIYSAALSAIAFTLWYTLLRHNTASSITIYKFLIPVFGSILSAIALPGENFTITVVIGLACASLGIYMVNGKKLSSIGN